MLTSLEESVVMPGLGLSLPLAEIYADIVLTPEKRRFYDDLP